jgi:hypothetical protein
MRPGDAGMSSERGFAFLRLAVFIAATSALIAPRPASAATRKRASAVRSAAVSATPTPADANLLLNGDIADGTGDRPDHWAPDGWKQGPEFTAYRWTHNAGVPAQLEIDNLKPNDARWMQPLKLAPGWYYLSAEVRTENVGAEHGGAAVSIVEDGVVSPELRGTTDWKRIGLYLKVAEPGAEVKFGCRLGSFANENSGKAFFRGARAIKAAAPASDAPAQFDLERVRNPQPAAAPPSGGGGGSEGGWLMIEIVASLVLLALIVWRITGGWGSPPSHGDRTDSRATGELSGGGIAALRGWLRAIRDRQQQLARDEPSPAPDSGPKANDRRIEIALFLTAFLSFAFFYQASDHSTACRFDLMRSILERGSIWIDGFAGYNTADIVNFKGHIYSVKAPGGALTGILQWSLVRAMLAPFHIREEGLYWALATWMTTVLSVSLLVACLTVIMYRFARFTGAGAGRSVATALTMALATIMFPYATEMTGEPIAGVCAFSSFYILATSRSREGIGWSALAGVLAGWAVLNDYPALLIAAAIGIYALWKLDRWGEVAAFAAGAGLIALAMFLHNQLAFGGPLFFSYQALSLPENSQFREQTVGFVGLTYPRIRILWNILIDPQRGLFFCNPVLLLTIPGLLYLWRQRRWRAEFATVAFVVVAFILFNASYGESTVSWGGGTATGPRQIVAAIPFMVFTLAFLPHAADYLFGALAMLSALLMLVATSVEPHFPYEYANPLRDFALPAYLRGDLAYNKSTYFGGAPVAGDSVAFNLGKLLGLPPAMQLWPLALVWIAGATELIDFIEVSPRVRQQDLAAGAVVLAIIALFAPPTIGAMVPSPTLSAASGLLGRYYEGLRPNGFPPHIVRVDRNVDFQNVTQLGALPFPSFVTWSGKLDAPRSGLYRFAIIADDTGWLRIDGRDVIADSGATAHPRTFGNIELTAGLHSIELGERNIAGDASARFLWQPPGATEQVVPSRVLIPDRYDRTRG